MAARRRQLHVELSLVPMADMLTNTVGIMIFVMIYVVLQAQASYKVMHLPMVAETKTDAVLFTCSSNGALPCHFDQLATSFLKDLPKLTAENYQQWQQIVNTKRVEDDLFILTGRCEIARQDDLFGYSIQCVWFELQMDRRQGVTPDTSDSVSDPSSLFRRELAGMDPKKQHILFLVDTYSIPVFMKARDVAREAGYESNWMPELTTWPIRVVLVPPGESGPYKPEDWVPK